MTCLRKTRSFCLGTEVVGEDLYEQRVQDFYTTYATTERLFDLSNDQFSNIT